MKKFQRLIILFISFTIIVLTYNLVIKDRTFEEIDWLKYLIYLLVLIIPTGIVQYLKNRKK